MSTVIVTVHRVYEYRYYYCTILLLSQYRLSTLSSMILIVLTELNNNINGQLTLRLGKIDGGDSVFILSEPRIQVTQSTEGSTVGFPGDG